MAMANVINRRGLVLYDWHDKTTQGKPEPWGNLAMPCRVRISDVELRACVCRYINTYALKHRVLQPVLRAPYFVGSMFLLHVPAGLQEDLDELQALNPALACGTVVLSSRYRSALRSVGTAIEISQDHRAQQDENFQESPEALKNTWSRDRDP
jgi:hypothetical protein